MTRYAIQADRSSLSAEASSSVHPIHAQSQQVAGWIEAAVVDGAVDTDQPANARLEITTNSLTADNKLVNREIQKRLDARRYPTVVAEINRVSGSTGNRYEIHGDLTLRHVTHPVTGWAELTSGDEKSVEITGELALDVRDFQLDPPKLLGMRVHPEVAVKLRIVATADHQ